MNKARCLVSICAAASLALPTLALAASTSDLNQTITAGSLSVDIMDASRVSVASPSAALSAKNFSFDCQFGANSSTGTFGVAAQRIYISNPGSATPNGWAVSLAATGGPTATWSNTGATKKFDFNDVTGANAGCSDGADTDTVAGQMTVDPSVGTLTTDCTSCTLTGVTKGSSSAFVEGTTNSITLVNASSGASNPFRGYLTGASIKQTLPAEQAADSTYALNMTLTVIAL